MTCYTGLTYKAKAFYAAWVMEENHPLPGSAKKAYESVFNAKVEPGIWDFSTNGAATKGLFEIPTIGFGPGDDRYAHTPDEQIPAGHLIKAVEFNVALVHNW